jgi:hypothetical protein
MTITTISITIHNHHQLPPELAFTPLGSPSCFPFMLLPMAHLQEVNIESLLEEEAHRLDSRLPSIAPVDAPTTPSMTLMTPTSSSASLAGRDMV